MTLEETLRALATKGELVHLSIAFIGKEYRAAFSSASAHGGYGFGAADDPVEAIEKALEAVPIKLRCSHDQKRSRYAPEPEITAAVSPEKEGALNSAWTTP